MKNFIGIVFLILGGLFLFKILTQGWLLFLLLALSLAASAATGVIAGGATPPLPC